MRPNDARNGLEQVIVNVVFGTQYIDEPARRVPHPSPPRRVGEVVSYPHPVGQRRKDRP